jgi:formate dehydrogenase iron-sulfur subunit
MSKVLYVDTNRCIYCRSCELACEREHNGRSHMSVVLLDNRYPVPMNCRHCEKNPCLVSCPTGAITREGNGPVIINSMQCIGCRICAMVCPFGILNLDDISRVMRKCDLCIHRLNEGKRPACVVTCPARALSFEEFDALMERLRRKAAADLIRGSAIGPTIVVTAGKASP